MTEEFPAFPLDHLPLRGAADMIALRLKDREYSYQTLNIRVGRLAKLLADLGFEAGDRVATWLPKTELACLMPLASVRAGLVHVPVNPLLKPAQVRHIMADSGARALLTSQGTGGVSLTSSPARGGEPAKLVEGHGEVVPPSKASKVGRKTGPCASTILRMVPLPVTGRILRSSTKPKS